MSAWLAGGAVFGTLSLFLHALRPDPHTNNTNSPGRTTTP